MKAEDSGSVDYTTFTLHKVKPEKRRIMTTEELIQSMIRDLERLV